jgi:hypothetical protein
MTRRPTLGRVALWFSPIVFMVAGFFATLTWLKPQNPVLVELLTAAAAIFVLGYGMFLGKRQSEGWDEVERAGWGFASAHWGWGYAATMVLFLVPPVMNGLINLMTAAAEHAGRHRLSPEALNHVAVQLAFWCGITLVLVMQTLAHIVATVVWWRRMGRSVERS